MSEKTSMLPIRQGDVIFKAVNYQITGRKIPHLNLAEEEVTGHSHRIGNGQAELNDYILTCSSSKETESTGWLL